MHQLPGHLYPYNLIGRVCERCREKTSRETIESKLCDTQCGFRPGRNTADKTFTLQQFSKSLESMSKTLTHVFSNSRKHTTALLVKKGETLCAALWEYDVNGRPSTKSRSSCSAHAVLPFQSLKKIWFILQSFGLFFCDLVYSLFF